MNPGSAETSSLKKTIGSPAHFAHGTVEGGAESEVDPEGDRLQPRESDSRTSCLAEALGAVVDDHDPRPRP